MKGRLELVGVVTLLVTMASCTSDELGRDDAQGTGEATLLPDGIETVFIEPRRTWWFWNDGEDFGTAWRNHDWTPPTGPSSGNAPLGYGESYLVTTFGYGPDPANKPITVYFRKAFFVEDPARVVALRLDVMYDDGLVFYINGQEGGRANLPSGAIAHRTLSSSSREANNAYVSLDASAARSALQAGWNTLAIEVHQQSRSSSDLVFDASLVGQLQSAPPPPGGGIPRGSRWSYWDQGGDLGTAWRGGSYDDASWPAGPGPLGYGESYLATTIGYGPDASNKHITSYFRRQFLVSDPQRVTSLRGELMFDDGAVVYLNGQAITSVSMPSGPPDATTLALRHEADATYQSFDWTAERSKLVAGINTIAVEVHQQSPSSSDLVFDLALTVDTGPVATDHRVDHYMIHYGELTPSIVEIAQSYPLVILDPYAADLTRARVVEIQRGIDPGDPSDDVLLLCYVSVGEDRRTVWLTDEELAADPRFIGDGSGPRVDPRGPSASGRPLEGIDPRGNRSAGGSGYASYYLDDNDVYRNGVGDGKPDRNAHFGGAFVNAGDPHWYDVVKAMSLDGPDGNAGLAEVLTTSYGRGLGCDGVFLDTFDTAAPNQFTNLASSNLSKFEWTAPGFQTFLQRLRSDYPGKLILQNRGLFFFDPRHPQFAVSTGALIDYLLFESFRLDSSSAHELNPYFYHDNRYNLAPKLMAEANRGRGFQVLSLGYAEGPPDRMSEWTLTGASTLGFESLLEDIRVAHSTGFRHYLSNASVTRTNTFVRDHANLDDAEPPVWTSTYNANNPGYPTPPNPPTPRIGLQELVPGPSKLTLRWDVALDMHRVRYAAYYQDHPFDFAGDPALSGATRRILTPRMGPGYIGGVGPARYPYEADLVGLAPGETYHVVVRAFDDTARQNEDANQRVLSAAPLP